MVGKHPITSVVGTQTIIALSSGESEFYSAVRGTCRTIGIQSLAADMGWKLEVVMVTDSTAAKGLASRRGAGTIRHIHCPALWLQQAIAQRRVTIEKKAGKELSPDIGTKAGISGPQMWTLLEGFGIVRARGRSTAQLELAKH